MAARPGQDLSFDPSSIDDTGRLSELRARYAPSHLVVSASTGLVRLFDGPFTAYMTQSSGIATLELFSLLRDNLRVPVRDALLQAEATGKTTLRQVYVQESNEHASELTILVEPLSPRHNVELEGSGEQAIETQFIVAFYPRPDDADFLRSPKQLIGLAGSLPTNSSREAKGALRELARVLEQTKENMEATLAEYEYLNRELLVKNDHLVRSNEDYRSLLDSTRIPTLFLDQELRVGSFTSNITELFALRVTDVGRSVTDLTSQLDYAFLPVDVRLVLGSAQVVEREVRTFDPEARVFLVRVQPHVLQDGETAGVVLTFVDITARKRAESEAWFLAHHDQLTGLPNRSMFRTMLEDSLVRSAASGIPVGLLYLDLDRFKIVNDTYGHRVGDRLLQIASTRLLACVPSDALVCRLGGDEFGILESSGHNLEGLVILANSIQAELSKPCEIESCVVKVGASIGIAARSSEMDIDALIRAADIALYDAKARKRGSHSVFHPQMEVEWQRRRSLEADLREAISHNELSLVYQPLVRLSDDRIAGAEALLRWSHPKLGTLPPADFIPVAEETGLIVPIGAWVLKTACADAARWPEPLCLSVNLSAAQFGSPSLLGTISDALAATGLPSYRLALEVTETALLHDNARTQEVLAAFRDLGLSIVMDDFGTGYSSLSYMRTFELDKVKIDQTFVRAIDTQPASSVIVKAIVMICEGLGLSVSAEGVETEEQLAALKGWGIQEAQGYLLHLPMSSGELLELLAHAKESRLDVTTVGVSKV